MPTTIILVIALASCDICRKSFQSSVCSIVSNRHMSGNKGLDDISSVLLLQMEALQFPGFSPAFVDPVLRKARPNKKDLATPLVFACVASDRSLSPVFSADLHHRSISPPLTLSSHAGFNRLVSSAVALTIKNN